MKLLYGLEPKPKRRAFKVTTKKKEWNKVAGRDDDNFKTTSKCRHCKRKLIWGSGTYDFDHKDNNPSNNSQKNCYLVCKVCHGKHTKLGKRAIKSFGITVGHKTIKKKVGYKKKSRKKTTRKKTKRVKSIWDI